MEEGKVGINEKGEEERKERKKEGEEERKRRWKNIHEIER